MTTTVDISRMLQEAESRRMHALLDAWNAEIEAAAEAAAQRNRDAEVHNAELASEAASEARRRIAALAAADVLDSSALETRLYGLVQQALAGYDISISLPEGVSVASTLIVAANDAETDVLFSKLELADDIITRRAQNSAAWAMEHGFVPHPKDLATLAREFEPNKDWVDHFNDLGRRLDKLVTLPNTPPQLQTMVGGARLDTVKQTVAALERYSPARALALIGSPSALAKIANAPDPIAKSTPREPSLGTKALGRVLDGIFRS